MRMQRRDDYYKEGDIFLGGGTQVAQAIDNYQSAIRAIEASTGELHREFPITPRTRAGVLATAGDVVFSASIDGYFFALDARSGEVLWKISLGGKPHSSPMTYAAFGKQYIVTTMGNVVYAFGL